MSNAEVEMRSGRFLTRLPVGVAAVLMAAAVAVGCGGEDSSGTSAASDGSGKCPLDGGVVKAFATHDLAGSAGDIGPSAKRAIEVWTKEINADGGILGCQLEVKLEDEAFPSVPECTRRYREATASREYAFYLGPFNSACLLGISPLVNAAQKPLISAAAGEHSIFFDKFEKYNFAAIPTTFLDGRASAKYAADQGWKRISILTPNYAYGQDWAKIFKDYFLKLVPDGEIVAEQLPDLSETNLQPFVNAALAPNPDAVVGGMFGGATLTAWKQWTAQKLDVPTLFAADLPTMSQVKSAADLPKNAHAYIKAAWEVTVDTPIGKRFTDAYTEAYGNSEHPHPSEYGFSVVSGLQLAKALAEETNGFDANAWVEAADGGNVTFDSPFGDDTKLFGANHTADGYDAVGPMKFDKQLGFPTRDIEKTEKISMSDVTDEDELAQLTTRDGD